jgi:hypothetical protein
MGVRRQVWRRHGSYNKETPECHQEEPGLPQIWGDEMHQISNVLGGRQNVRHYTRNRLLARMEKAVETGPKTLRMRA